MNINYIYLDITDKCNLNCVYCCKKKTTNYNGSEINMNVLNNILNFGRCYGATSITLSGGEPCLHSNFDQVIEKVKEAGYESLQVMTNGFLFKTQDRLKNIDLIDEICYSIDSADIVRNGSTRVGFEKEHIDWIKEFRESHKDILLSIKSTITKYNSDCLEALVRFAQKYKFSKLTFGYCLPIGLAADTATFSEIACTPADMLNVQNEVKKLQMIYKDIEIVEPCIVFGCKLLQENNMLDLHIDECGNIFPCDGMNDDRYIVGNIKNENLIPQMLANINQIKESIRLRNEVCNKCSIKEHCKGVCLLYGEPLNNHDGDKFCAFRRVKIYSNKMVKEVEFNE